MACWRRPADVRPLDRRRRAARNGGRSLGRSRRARAGISGHVRRHDACRRSDAVWAWHHAVPGADVSLFLHPNDHPHDSDLVEIDESGRITRLPCLPPSAGRVVAQPRERRALCRAPREPASVGRLRWPSRFRQGSFSAHAGGRSDVAWLRLARIHQGRRHARTAGARSQRADFRRNPSRIAE